MREVRSRRKGMSSDRLVLRVPRDGMTGVAIEARLPLRKAAPTGDHVAISRRRAIHHHARTSAV